jgi:hypothetical protein
LGYLLTKERENVLFFARPENKTPGNQEERLDFFGGPANLYNGGPVALRPTLTSGLPFQKSSKIGIPLNGGNIPDEFLRFKGI